MKISKRSALTGFINSMDIDIDPESYEAWRLADETSKPFVQNFFPGITPEEAEFILTGITIDEWDRTISDNDEEDE